MNNFYCYNPTKIIFGKDMIARMPNELNGIERILLLYGSGSIKQNGVYDQVIKALAGKTVIEFAGIEPNPEYETCRAAIRLAREKGVDFVLAVGGGSVIDAAKFIALAAHFEGDEPWQIITRAAQPPARTLPLGCVQTLPASGSEMNNAFVLSRRAQCAKLGFFHMALYPRFSILDPQATFTLSKQQTALGMVDMFVHVLEQYITYPSASPLQARQAEAILAAVAETAEPLLNDLNNYDLRATIMWCGTQAVNGLINRGVPTDWATHAIGHELTALYDLPHAQTLALVLGGTYRHQLANKQACLAQYGRRVWQLTGSDEQVAAAAIAATEAFFERLGVATRLSAVGLKGEEVAEAVCAKFAAAGNFQNLGERQAIDLDAVGEILRMQA
ncbi:MAG TPA: iron-containing alcohol dehydrogenase [Rhodocyclaceae bacterium]